MKTVKSGKRRRGYESNIDRILSKHIIYMYANITIKLYAVDLC
jgi:hypothetical protein